MSRRVFEIKKAERYLSEKREKSLGLGKNTKGSRRKQTHAAK
jgi:hypothetical protein